MVQIADMKWKQQSSKWNKEKRADTSWCVPERNRTCRNDFSWLMECVSCCARARFDKNNNIPSCLCLWIFSGGGSHVTASTCTNIRKKSAHHDTLQYDLQTSSTLHFIIPKQLLTFDGQHWKIPALKNTCTMKIPTINPFPICLFNAHRFLFHFLPRFS